jgi:uncharacterized protein
MRGTGLCGTHWHGFRNGNWVLRVVYTEATEPRRVVTAYFDRTPRNHERRRSVGGGGLLKEAFRELETRLLEEAVSFYGERLVTVAVYGSVARGTQRFDSDLDVLVVAGPLPDGRMKRIREFEEVENRIEPHIARLRQKGIDTFVSAVIKTPEEIGKGSPLLLDMVEDCRILIDKDGFFAGVLEKLRGKLEALGARRIWRGNAWYWDLKPDYKPGDVIDL